MAKRKRDAALIEQMDMFGALEALPASHSNTAVARTTPLPANDVVDASSIDAYEIALNREPKLQISIKEHADFTLSPKARILSSRAWLNDEWWTLSMVCVYLQVSRKTIWSRQHNTKVHFPQHVCMGSSRPRWRSAEVRAWACAETYEP